MAHGVTLLIAVLFVLLGVASMFAILFWTNWNDATDPTDVLQQRQRQRLLPTEQTAA
jgi:hypothetical protein